MHPLSAALFSLFTLVFSTIAAAQSVPPVVNLKADLSRQYQTIENFGGSDAWAAQHVGNWPDSSRNAIADLLFSTELTSSGKPKGIGLTMWRFNIGAGSTQQGRESGIRDEWRRAPSFYENGTYNWDQQAGQMWFLQAAKKRGVPFFLGFTNSPPVHLTANGKAYATASKPNLTPDKFDAFADYLVEIVKGIKAKTGVQLDYLSPVNEPQWDWSDGGQEGSPFTNKDISGITRSLNAAIVKAKLKTKISLAESGQYDFLYSDLKKPDKGFQINAFFNPASPEYVGNLPSVEKTISAHSYFTTSPYAKAAGIRKQIAETVATIKGLRFWQSEYCILGDNAGEIRGNRRDLGITSGLYVAKVIHNDLVNANASAWHWWTSISAYDYKDGLVYVDKAASGGKYYSSKILWAMGNYSRFIRPGAVRVEIEAAELSGQENLLVSSYFDKKSKELITVLINQGQGPLSVSLGLKKGKLGGQRAYITSEQADLEPLKIASDNGAIELAAKSVTTIISKVK